MSIRKSVAILAVICASLLVVPVAASAKSTTPATSFRAVPIQGKATNGTAFTGHYTVSRFATRNGRTVAIGTLTGKLGSQSVHRSNLAIPIVTHHGQATAAATCPILHLTLGPLDLNLLGLTVHLNTVVLNIDAHSGPGNLLGNLLCSVANLLNGPGLLQSQITALENLLVALGL